MNFFGFLKSKSGTLLIATGMLLCCFSCIQTDDTLGGNYITTSQLYDVYTADIPITAIDNQLADSLSGYSRTRIGVGAIRDEQYGLSTRSCALSLVPVRDTMDFGTNPQFKSFHFSAALDTISVAEKGQENILQKVYVYALDERAGYPDYNINTKDLKYTPKLITKGIPVIDGVDSLSFDFTEEFGKRYLSITQADLEDSLSHYLKKFPGIYITCEEPDGNGGRFNFFDLGMAFNKNYMHVTGSSAILNLRSTYNGRQVDTSFMFYFSPPEFTNLDSLVTISNLGSVTFEQYCFNINA
jgi:hypothetical protein